MHLHLNIFKLPQKLFDYTVTHGLHNRLGEADETVIKHPDVLPETDKILYCFMTTLFVFALKYYTVRISMACTCFMFSVR